MASSSSAVVAVSSSSSKLFPHPLAKELRTSSFTKMFLPFVLAMINLAGYAVLDRYLPSGTTYGSFEYSFTVTTFGNTLATLSLTQYAVLSAEAALHLGNAVLYAATLSAWTAFLSLQYRSAGYYILAICADIACYMQFFTFFLYLLEHISVLIILINNTVYSPLPLIIALASICFLAEIVIVVVFSLISFIWVWKYKSRRGKLPCDLALAPMSPADEGFAAAMNIDQLA